NPAEISPNFIVVQTAIKIDTRAPAILSTTAGGSTTTLPGTYKVGDTLKIELTYDEVVFVDETNGTPFIPLTFTSGAANLNYVSGSGTTKLVFSRLLEADHFDMDGLPASITTVTLAGGTIK